MGAREQSRPRTAGVLQAWRQKKRLSKQGLADRSDVSGTYVRMIEDGFDPQTGKPVIPSAKVIMQLARALGEGDPSEEKQIYEELMGAAGYLDGATAIPPRREIVTAGGAHDVALFRAAPSPATPGVTVALRDPRLHAHCRELLDNWEVLSSEDQAALLAFMEFIAERCRRDGG